MSNVYPRSERPTLEMYKIAWLGKQAEAMPQQFIEGASREGLKNPEEYPSELTELGRRVSWDIALGHIGLVKSVANKMARSDDHPTMTRDDFTQVGLEGVYRYAGDYYRFREELQPSTFFKYAIRNSISRYIADNSTTVRIPVYARPLLSRLDTLTGSGNSPDNAFIKLKIDSEKTRKRLQVARLLTTELGSTDTGFNPDSDVSSGNGYSKAMKSVFDTNPEDEAEIMQKEIFLQEVRKVLISAGLDDRAYKIISMRFGFDCEPRTLEEIGQHFSLTRERIRQIEAQTLKRLRTEPIGYKLRALAEE